MISKKETKLRMKSTIITVVLKMKEIHPISLDQPVFMIAVLTLLLFKIIKMTILTLKTSFLSAHCSLRSSLKSSLRLEKKSLGLTCRIRACSVMTMTGIVKQWITVLIIWTPTCLRAVVHTFQIHIDLGRAEIPYLIFSKISITLFRHTAKTVSMTIVPRPHLQRENSEGLVWDASDA
jgi:hypothetical protein